MSAFIVADKHIDFLLTAALKFSDPRYPIRWQVGESLPTDHQPGSPWGPTAVASAKRRRRELTRETADVVGSILLAENYRSVNYRYDEGDAPPFYQFSEYQGSVKITPENVFRALSCLDYQSCEHPEWEESEAQSILNAIRRAMINTLPGVRASKVWEVTE